MLNLSTQTAQPARRHTLVLEGRKVSTVDPAGTVTQLLAGVVMNAAAIVTIPAGGFVVADTGNHALVFVAKDGTTTTSAAKLEAVTALARAPSGEIYAADSYGESRTGAHVFLAPQPDGSIAISDPAFHAIRRLEPDGRLVTTTTGLDTPYAITSGDKALFVTELTSAVRRLDGLATTKLAPFATFSRPYGVARDSKGNVIVAAS